MKTKLLSSSPSLEMVKDSIARYFFSDIKNVKAIPTDKPNIWDVHNLKGHLKSYRIIKKKDRFRFELFLDDL